jgi:hypothetical protein
MNEETTSPDQLAIPNLLALYCHLVDDGHHERLVEVFAPDGRFAAQGVAHQGVRAIIDLMTNLQSEDRRGAHHLSIPLIVIGGDTATSTVDVAFFRRHEGGWRSEIAGRYHDTLVRTPEGWRIATRDFVVK